MPSKIDWTDAAGAASLSNGKAVPMDRFSAWTPMSKPVGPAEPAVGTGQRYTFPFRTDHTASFEIRGIPNTSMALMLRLQDWLLRGGVVSVTTGDTLSSVYATCCLAPDSVPQITPSDPGELEYTMGLQLLNVAGSPVRLICQY